MSETIKHNIFVTVDTAVFTVHDDQLMILLVKRDKSAAYFPATWSLPGGIIDERLHSNADQTAKAKLFAKTGVQLKFLEQLKTFTGAGRDPRGWSVSIAYFILIPYVECSDEAESIEEVRWVAVSELPDYGDLAFDHSKIIEVAAQRLRDKTLYTLLPAYCLEETFTLNELHAAFESILDQKTQKKSLYRRIEASQVLEATGSKRDTCSKKAALFRVTKGTRLYTFDRNLIGQ